MPNEEQDAIAHLLKVEEEAAELIVQAQEQSDKEIAAARAKTDSDYNQKYQDMASQMESDYNNKVAAIQENHKKQLEEYKAKIEQTPKDVGAFNKLLENIF